MQPLVPRQSQLFNADCVDAAVVNGSSKYPLCNGTFVRCNVPSGECNASRGIFKGPGNKFLYYWRDLERWVIGDDHSSPKGWVCSVGCTTSCPTEVSSWKEWDTTTREFYIEPAITVHRSFEFASSVVVSGDLTYPTCVGTYTRSNILPNANHAGRVILKGPGSKHMFYWSAISKWIIGDDYNLLKGWYCSNHSEGSCPTHVSGWKEWDPSIARFEAADRVRVQQEGDASVGSFVATSSLPSISAPMTINVDPRSSQDRTSLPPLANKPGIAASAAVPLSSEAILAAATNITPSANLSSDRRHDFKPSLGGNRVQDGTLVQVATRIVNDRSSPANNVHFEESFQSFPSNAIAGLSQKEWRMPPPTYWQLVGSESGEERELRITEQRQLFQQRMRSIRRLSTQPNFLQRMQRSSSAVMPFGH